MLTHPQLLKPMLAGTEAQAFRSGLRDRIVGQEEAIDEVVGVYQAFLLGMSPRNRPVGSFLFLGPTGTGKTRLAEATAECLAGDVKALIKINCGEFQHGHEVAKLTGAPPGYVGHRDTRSLLSQERLSRFHKENLKLSFVLFDEIEKANGALWDLLLGVLDKAALSLGDNGQVDFSNTMIFLTGNVGAAEMQTDGRAGFGLVPSVRTRVQIHNAVIEAARRRFSPEFFNRIDKISVFGSLNEDALRAVLDLELRAIEERFNERTRFLLSLTEDAKVFLLGEGTDKRYGARHLKRVMERSLVDPLCNLLATSQLNNGDQIRVDISRDANQLLFYKDAENIVLPELPARTVVAPEPPPAQKAAEIPIGVGWCCF